MAKAVWLNITWPVPTNPKQSQPQNINITSRCYKVQHGLEFTVISRQLHSEGMKGDGEKGLWTGQSDLIVDLMTPSEKCAKVRTQNCSRKELIILYAGQLHLTC